MRTYVYEPRAGERVTRTFSGLVLYSEIFQQTDPIRRLAVQFASRGTHRQPRICSGATSRISEGAMDGG